MIYLLHFDHSIGSNNSRGQAAHYIGFSDNLGERMMQHRQGHGAAITKFLVQNNIDWTLVRVWKGGRRKERSIKNQKNAKRHCPLCKGVAT